MSFKTNRRTMKPFPTTVKRRELLTERDGLEEEYRDILFDLQQPSLAMELTVDEKVRMSERIRQINKRLDVIYDLLDEPLGE